MMKNDIIATLFTKISQLKDQITAIGENMDDDDLVQKTIDGLPPTWETFVSGICAHENQ